MNRALLSLPVCLLGLPLLVCLILASLASSLPEAPAPDKPEERPAAKASLEGPLPDEDAMEKLARKDLVAFLEWTLERYRREVTGYSLTLEKREFANPREVMEVHFREKPHSVYMRWKEGNSLADKALYVEGENDGKILARVFVLTIPIDLKDPRSEKSSRYPISEFGFKKGCERSLAAVAAAKAKGILHVDYQGQKKVKELDDRMCYVFHRTNEVPENDGVMDLMIIIDKETWLLTGSIVKGAEGRLLGEYYFRDVKLNPTFKENQFKPSALQQ